MLRQLARLTRPVPAAGPKALTVAVYSRPDGQLLDARETGVEGVACVDDAARACSLLCRLWAATGNPALRAWAEGLLDFVLWMEEAGGRWHNFIYDWEGTRNVDGPTSAPGVNYWQARATCALTDAVLLLEDERARKPLDEALAAASAAAAEPGVRCLHALAALDLLQRGADPRLGVTLDGWCEEILSSRSGAMLTNLPGELGRPHLWGHVQEAVFVDAAAVLGREDLQDVAVESGEVVFADVIRSGFDLPLVCPYDVQSAVFVMDRLAERTADDTYSELGRLARSWFAGRNPAGTPAYDRATGRVLDGIENGSVNSNSGAESNVAAGFALMDDPMVMAQARTWTNPW